MNDVKFNMLEVAGIYPALKGMRLPTKSKNDSTYDIRFDDVDLGDKDKLLAMRLVSKGTVHGKFQRSIIAWFEINMPRYMWSELDTYTVGVSPTSSESTMYTLVKECADITPDMFVKHTPEMVIRNFAGHVKILEEMYDGRKNIPIHILKSALPEGFMQKRIKAYSYQTLKGIYHYRKNHRLPEWQVICDAIEKLPYASELLFGCDIKDFPLD
jgi:hypothetical protein